MSDNDARLALMKLCRGIFGTSNLIGTDFDDVRVFEVAGRNLPQQIDGNGLHVSFSIGNYIPKYQWKAIAQKATYSNQNKLVLLPDALPKGIM